MKFLINQKRSLITCISLIIAWIPTFSLLIVSTISENSKPSSLNLFLIFILTFMFLQLNTKKAIPHRAYFFSVLGGFLYAFFYIYGTILHQNLTTYRSIKDFLLSILIAAGYSIFSISFLLTLLLFLPDIRIKLAVLHLKEKRIHNTFFIYIFYTSVIFISYIPMFLAYYPILLQYDGVDQLRQCATNVFTKWHPLAHTYVLDLCYTYGLATNDLALGMSLYSIFQMLVLSCSFAYCMYILYKSGIPRWFRILALCFFALFPIHPIFAITTTKDILFAAFFLVFLVLLVNCMILQKHMNVLQLIVTTVFGCLLLLYRNNAFYALLASIPPILFIIKNMRIKLATIFLSSIICYLCLNNIFVSTMHAIDTSNITEMLSVPLMQMVKATQEHSDTMEISLKDRVYTYIPEEQIQGSGLISDSVKSSADNGLICADPIAFIKLWAELGLKYPMEYLDAFGLLTMGYWYIEDEYHALIYGRYMLLGHRAIGIGEEIPMKSLFPSYRKVIDGLFLENEYRDVPVLATLCQPALYFWILIVYILIVWYEKRFILLTPAIFCTLYYATLFLGPVALVRYMYCIIVTTPLLLCLILQKDARIDLNPNI